MARRKKSSGWDFVERLNNVVEEKLDELAKTVQREMRDIVEDYSDTGRENKITITKQAEHARFVGAIDLGLFYLDQGNGGSNRLIYPRRKNGTMVWVDNATGQFFARKVVHGYNGIHFVRRVADRHR